MSSGESGRGENGNKQSQDPSAESRWWKPCCWREEKGPVHTPPVSIPQPAWRRPKSQKRPARCSPGLGSSSSPPGRAVLLLLWEEHRLTLGPLFEISAADAVEKWHPDSGLVFHETNSKHCLIFIFSIDCSLFPESLPFCYSEVISGNDCITQRRRGGRASLPVTLHRWRDGSSAV